MNLFDLSGSDVTIHADMLAVPEFESIWNKYEDKHIAKSIIKYIILNNYPLSPYVRSYLEKDRIQVLEDRLLRSITYDKTELTDAEEAFLSLFNTLSMKALRYMRNTLDKLISDELMNSSISIRDAIELQPKLEKAIDSIKRLEDIVRMELSSKSKIKGGYKLGILEQADGIK